MNEAALALIFALVEEAVKITPGIVADIQALFAKGNPTPEDWAAFHAKVKAKKYADYVPASDLPPALPPELLAAAKILPPVTDQAKSDAAPVTIPGPDTPAASPAPAAPWTAAHVFAKSTTRN